MAAERQSSFLNDVFVLSTDSDRFASHGQSYVGKLRYAYTRRLSLLSPIHTADAT